MNSMPDQVDEPHDVSSRDENHGTRFHVAGPVPDWLHAERTDRRQLDTLQQRVDELETLLSIASQEDLSRRLFDAQTQLADAVAECRRAEQHLAGEHQVSRLLAESTQFDEAASQILQAICECLGWDVGVFWIVDRESDVLRCAEFWHAHSVEVCAFEDLSRQTRFASGIGLPGRIWASGAPAWVPDMTHDADLPRSSTAAAVGLHAAVAFPVHNGVEYLGVMEFLSREIRQPDDKLFAMMRSIGSGISEFIERRRAEETLLHQTEERRLAQRIQEGLLPKAMPYIEGLSLGGRCLPSRLVGGDYFDVFTLPNGCLYVVIADASGHGLPAALVITETRAYLRAFASTTCDLGDILQSTNCRLAEDLDSEHFVTLFLARFDPATHALTYSSAGHCTGYLLNSGGDIKTALASTATPLGLLPGREFPSSGELLLAAGELLFLHTDGVVDAGATGAGEVLGSSRALNIVREHRHKPPLEILDALFDAVSAFSVAEDVSDDATAVIIKVDAPPAARPVPRGVSMGVGSHGWTRFDLHHERHLQRRDDAKGWR